jgi:hypothetical protein
VDVANGAAEVGEELEERWEGCSWADGDAGGNAAIGNVS